MEWSKKQTLDLIELIHIHDCLWNVQSESYKDRQKKRDSIEDIASRMNISFNDIEKKITNLKNQYNRELNKIKTKSGCGTEDVYVSSWYAFKALSFLKSNNLPRKSRSSDSMIEEYNCEDEYIDNPINVVQCTTTPSRPEMLQILSPNELINQSAKRFIPDRQAEAFEMMKEARNNIINSKKKDEFDIFGEYVASELRGIKGEKNILDIKKQIQDLIYYKKIEQIDTGNKEESENIPIVNTTSNQISNSSTQVVNSPDNTYIEDEIY